MSASIESQNSLYVIRDTAEHVARDTERFSNAQKKPTGSASRLLKYENFHKHFNTPPFVESPWERVVLPKIASLVKLPPSWDSYGGNPTRLDVAMYALIVLQQVMQPRSPLPQLVPMSDGRIQIEWHERGIDIELSIKSPGDCSIYFCDHWNGEEKEGPVTSRLEPLSDAVDKITRR